MRCRAIDAHGGGAVESKAVLVDQVHDHLEGLAGVSDVVDDQVGVLPNSGSAGIYPHLGLGAALLGLAGACGWARRRSA